MSIKLARSRAQIALTKQGSRGSHGGYAPAPLMLRIRGFVTDALMIGVPFYMLFAYAGHIVSQSQQATLLLEVNTFFSDLDKDPLSVIPKVYFYGIALVGVWEASFIILANASPGMKLSGIVVRSAKRGGGKPNLMQKLLRGTLGILSYWMLGIPSLITNSEGRSIVDRLANTTVATKE